VNVNPRGRADDPTGRPDLTFNPLATGIGVFTAVAAPVAAVGLSLSGRMYTLLPGAGIVLGLVSGLAAGLWLGRRGGKVWNGPQL
jgi:NO-binding membrane sensor protein with MHYT domain